MPFKIETKELLYSLLKLANVSQSTKRAVWVSTSLSWNLKVCIKSSSSINPWLQQTKIPQLSTSYKTIQCLTLKLLSSQFNRIVLTSICRISFKISNLRWWQQTRQLLSWFRHNKLADLQLIQILPYPVYSQSSLSLLRLTLHWLKTTHSFVTAAIIHSISLNSLTRNLAVISIAVPFVHLRIDYYIIISNSSNFLNRLLWQLS